MVAEIISVGTEILMGNIVNTNAAYIAEQLAFLGISCYYQTTVGDNPGRVENVVKTSLERSDVLILTGGLGPTDDDLTKEICAKAMGRELYEDAKARQMLEDFFKMREFPITENNWKQAMVPEGSIVMYNNNGTAPGMIIENEEKTKAIILLPGPPGEMKPMFNEQVKPYLMEKNNMVIYSAMVKMCGIGESKVENDIKDLIESTNPTVATYAKVGEVHVRVTAMASDEKEAKKLVKPVVKELKARFGAKIYSTNDEVSLEESVVELLEKNGLSIATAESCTGGLLAGRIINVPGASDVFKEGIITYSNKAKKNRLNVKKSTLIKHGAVSKQCAEEMVKGLISYTKSDAGLAVTGIAGPGGGTDEKPVGLVYISCFVGGKVVVKEHHFSGNRAKIRESATAAALTLLRQCVLEYTSDKMFNK